MYQYLNKYYLVLSVFLSSCGLIDLRPVSITTVPAEANAILVSRTDCLETVFSSEPDRLDAERIFMVRSPSGTVEGDFIWNGNGFAWKPVSPWDPGVRYRLILRGSLNMADGREASPEIDMPFYVQRMSARPSVLSSIPPDGASTGVVSGDAGFFQVQFSESMDAGSVEKNLTIRPSVDCFFSWNTDFTILHVFSEDKLEPCTVYRWTIGADARADDETPLANSDSGIFVTDLDTIPPRVERVYATVLSGGVWVEAAQDLSVLDSGHSIAILFSEDVDAASVRSCVRIEPSQSGTVLPVTPRLAVYTPERGWIPETPLTLVVSENITDMSGLRSGSEFRSVFTPVVPYLHVLTVSSSTNEPYDGSGNFPVSISAPPEGLLVLTFNFSQPFGYVEKTIVTERIFISAIFPGSLPAPNLRDAIWFSDDTLSMTWEGLRASDATSVNYYRLTIPGGQAGILSASRNWMAEDVSICLEVDE